MTKVEIFENFIINNMDNVYRFAYSYVKNKHDAEDVVNESVVKALKAIRGLRNPDYIKPWFYKIVSNTSINLINKNKRVVSLNFEESQFQCGVFDDYSYILLESLIQKLDVKYKEVIILRFFEDMAISEIAHVLSLNENTVKSRLYRAEEFLKQIIEEDIK